ncbi:hypothetical protein GCM10009555_022820 [Acrocarpospora macrocephala]|uniref:Uncharacterized protein n=1 Tax=Acrocarpospora macrocephala TaxID=150177 RepID=A0A5M3WTJ3_9ACTN|nr:SIR2 family protein [Acrocarpospora macrocephala]GES12214.1 hypothetical protein Amac_058110 [Acrocarpospora macrocephala]
MREVDWNRLIDGLTTGDCTPFLGAGVSRGTLPTGSELSEDWANRLGYPFKASDLLPEVMDYAMITQGDSIYVKRQVIQELTARGRPDFSSDVEAHAVMARFPIPVYFTTNYDDFMVEALKRAGKQPTALSCPWHVNRYRQNGTFGPELIPSPGEPVVFHLHGNMADPSSLVLSKSDYIEFLISLSMDHASDDHAMIPSALLPALTTRPLLFIGYSLQDWSFAVLFQGLLKTVSAVHHRRHISVQLLPPTVRDGADDSAQNYLTEFFGRWNISVYWGKVEDFCSELRTRMGWGR